MSDCVYCRHAYWLEHGWIGCSMGIQVYSENVCNSFEKGKPRDR
jgi:hypothetical protein